MPSGSVRVRLRWPSSVFGHGAPVTQLSRLLKRPPVDTVTDYVRVMGKTIAYIPFIYLNEKESTVDLLVVKLSYFAEQELDKMCMYDEIKKVILIPVVS